MDYACHVRLRGFLLNTYHFTLEQGKFYARVTPLFIYKTTMEDFHPGMYLRPSPYGAGEEKQFVPERSREVKCGYLVPLQDLRIGDEMDTKKPSKVHR